MKVLVVHNRYVSSVPSGENAVVDTEAAALSDAGVDVVTHIRSSDEIPSLPLRQRLMLPLRPLWSSADTAAIERLITRERPDILHLHNPNPLISMGVVRTAKKRGVPVVRTVHNHRHSCLNGLFFRDGHECHDCVGHHIPHPGVQHACYRGSRAQSVAAAAALTAHRRSYALIDKHIALTPQIARSVIASGIPETRVVVKPNSVPDRDGTHTRGRGIAFVGRLTIEKGIPLLLDAWRRHQGGGTLTIAGDGTQRQVVEAAEAACNDVVFLGRVDNAAAIDVMRHSAAVVVPSVWPEAMPLVVLEAFSVSRPVVGTRVGGLTDVLSSDVGWCVPPSASALAGAIDAALTDTDKGRRAREVYERRYRPDVVMSQLLGIYRGVLEDAATGTRDGLPQGGSGLL